MSEVQITNFPICVCQREKEWGKRKIESIEVFLKHVDGVNAGNNEVIGRGALQ